MTTFSDYPAIDHSGNVDVKDLYKAALRMCESAVKQCPGFDGRPCKWYRHCKYELDCPTYASAYETVHAIVDPVGDYTPKKMGSRESSWRTEPSTPPRRGNVSRD